MNFINVKFIMFMCVLGKFWERFIVIVEVIISNNE